MSSLRAHGWPKAANAKASKNSLHAIHNPGPLMNQALPLPIRATRIPILNARDRRHTTMALLSPQPADKGPHQEADHRLNGLCIAFAISFPTRSRKEGSQMSAGSVLRSNSRRRSASSLDILLTDPGLSVRLDMEVGRALPLRVQ
jgi:hypothetical protein